MFDAKEYLDTLEVPVYNDSRGRIHRGKILSYQEWLPYQARIQASLEAGMNHTRVRGVVKSLSRIMFPRRGLQKVNPFFRSVAQDVMDLPPQGMLGAFWSFTRAQGKAIGVDLEATPAMTQVMGLDVETAEESGDVLPVT